MKTSNKFRKFITSAALTLAVVGSTSFVTAGQANALEGNSEPTGIAKSYTKMDEKKHPKAVHVIDKKYPKVVNKLEKDTFPKAYSVLSK